MTLRKTYSQRYPFRSKVQTTIVVSCLALLVIPSLRYQLDKAIGTPVCAIEPGKGGAE